MTSLELDNIVCLFVCFAFAFAFLLINNHEIDGQ